MDSITIVIVILIWLEKQRNTYLGNIRLLTCTLSRHLSVLGLKSTTCNKCLQSIYDMGAFFLEFPEFAVLYEAVDNLSK